MPEPQTQQVVETTTSNPQDRYEQVYGTSTQATQQAPDLAAEVASLKAQIAALAKPAATQSEKSWLELLKDGHVEDAEKIMAQRLGLIQNLDDRQQRAVQEALTLFDARQQVAMYTAEVKAKPENAAILPMQRQIEAIVDHRMRLAQAEGKIKLPSDYVTVYKQVVEEETTEARKLALTLRGEGKQEGQTRITEVFGNPNLRPNQVNTQQATQQGETTQEGESTSDYFAKRKQRESALRGLTVA